MKEDIQSLFSQCRAMSLQISSLKSHAPTAAVPSAVAAPSSSKPQVPPRPASVAAVVLPRHAAPASAPAPAPAPASVLPAPRPPSAVDLLSADLSAAKRVEKTKADFSKLVQSLSAKPGEKWSIFFDLSDLKSFDCKRAGVVAVRLLKLWNMQWDTAPAISALFPDDSKEPIVWTNLVESSLVKTLSAHAEGKHDGSGDLFASSHWKCGVPLAKRDSARVEFRDEVKPSDGRLALYLSSGPLKASRFLSELVRGSARVVAICLDPAGLQLAGWKAGKVNTVFCCSKK